MFRFALIGALSCAALSFGAVASAQTPQIQAPGVRTITAPRVQLITPAARAALASRLAAQPIDAREISEPVSVSITSPLVGDPAAPTLALSAYSANIWTPFGDNPRVSVSGASEARVRVTMQLSAGYRYLLVCNMESRAFEVRDSWNGRVISWEALNQGAVLIAAQERDGMSYVDFYPTGRSGWLRSCEVSRIG